MLSKKGPDVEDLEGLGFSNLCLSLLQKIKHALERTVSKGVAGQFAKEITTSHPSRNVANLIGRGQDRTK